jgi:hypothetical protein
MKWRRINPCPEVSPDGYMCTGESGHAPLVMPEGSGEHYADEWRDGEIVGPVMWDAS